MLRNNCYAFGSRRRAKVTFALYITIAALYVFFGLQQPSLSSAAGDFASDAGGISGFDQETTFLAINSIDLKTAVVESVMDGRTLSVPEKIVGSFSNNKNKTLLFGHSSTVFHNLKNVKIGDMINYDQRSYKITNVETRKKSDISMRKLLSEEEKDTIVLMTCAGESLGDDDYTHRLIVTAEITEA